MEADTHERWQHGGTEPEFFELYSVPTLFGPMALRLLEQVPLAAGQQVLDVACGTGVVARLVAPRVAPAGTVIGIDLNPAMLAVARQHAPDGNVTMVWKQGDASALPFADHSFDAVLCQQGLQFFPDKITALREMYRVARAGGIVGIAVFGRASRFNTALAEALAKHVGQIVASRALAPFSFADPKAMSDLFRQIPFSAVECRTINITRYVRPTQEWLLQYCGGTPLSAAVADLEPSRRAEIVREIAANLKNFWNADHFAVPSEVHLWYARKEGAS
ncbi:MAG: class I SAM-dependent methyltransferase [Betaproteobacteria bacterium]